MSLWSRIQKLALNLMNLLEDDHCFVKFGLLKGQKLKCEELSVAKQFEVLTKYTQVLHDVIDIDDKVHLVGNHGAPVWADRWIDTCIPWQVNMPCPFNTYDENDQIVTSCSMPKEVYEDTLPLM